MDFRKHAQNKWIVVPILGGLITVAASIVTCNISLRASAEPYTRAPRDIKELEEDFTKHEEFCDDAHRDFINKYKGQQKQISGIDRKVVRIDTSLGYIAAAVGARTPPPLPPEDSP